MILSTSSLHQFSVSAHLLSATATSFDLAFPMFLSGIDHAMLSLSMLPVSHSLVRLYSSHQYLFLPIFILSLSIFILPINLSCNSSVAAFRSISLLFSAESKRSDLSTALYRSELLLCTTGRQKSVGINLYVYSTVFAFVCQFYPTVPFSS